MWKPVDFSCRKEKQSIFNAARETLHMVGQTLIFLWLCVASLDSFVIPQGSRHWRSTGEPGAWFMHKGDPARGTFVRVPISRSLSAVTIATHEHVARTYPRVNDVRGKFTTLKPIGLIRQRVQSAHRESVQCLCFQSPKPRCCVLWSMVGFSIRFSSTKCVAR